MEEILNNTENYKVIVIGAGQAGLSVGYFLSKMKIPFLILEKNKRVGDTWRNRWDSLRLFTPAKYDSLAGMPFPSDPYYFPSKDEFADYLENYAEHFNLPVRTGIKIDGLSREGEAYCLRSGENHFKAEHVVIAMSNYQNPRIPKFAEELNKDIIQLHSFDYRNTSQLKEGPVLVVGAGNSGAEIALQAAKSNHKVWLAGRDVGNVPFNIEGTAAKVILVKLVLRFLFHRVLTINTPIGRKVRPKFTSQGGPLIRIKPKEIIEAGITRVPKINGVKNGLPQLENGEALDVKNVIWCTGFYPSFSWIDIPIFQNKAPMQNHGVVEKEPGLYFVGLHFLYSLSSAMIHGVERDAKYVSDVIQNRLSQKV